MKDDDCVCEELGSECLAFEGEWALEDMSIEKEIIERANQLARRFYLMQGCQVDESYKFYEATHPKEVGCWNMVVEAFDFIEGTDVEDCLSILEDERE